MSLEKTKRNKKIYELKQKGLSYRQLGKIFDMDASAVVRIVQRETKKRVLTVFLIRGKIEIEH